MSARVGHDECISRDNLVSVKEQIEIYASLAPVPESLSAHRGLDSEQCDEQLVG